MQIFVDFARSELHGLISIELRSGAGICSWTSSLMGRSCPQLTADVFLAGM